MQIQIPRPQNPIGGASNQQTHPTPAAAGIEMSRYSLVQNARQGAVIPQIHQGALAQQTHPTPRVAGVEYSRYKALDAVRVIPGAIPQLHQGPTIQRTDPIAVFGQPVFSRYDRPKPSQFPAVIERLPAYPLVAHVVASSANSTDATTAAIDTTGATILVISAQFTAAQVAVITDSKSNTWTAIPQVDGTIDANQIFYALNPIVGAGHTFTITAPKPALEVQAWKGATFAFDVSNTAAGSTPQGASVTPSANNSLIVSGMATAASGVFSVSSGFVITDVDPGSASQASGAMAYYQQAVAAAITPTWTIFSGNIATATAVFKPSPATFEFTLPQPTSAWWPKPYQPGVARGDFNPAGVTLPTLVANTCAGSVNATDVTTSAIDTTGASLIILSVSFASGQSFTPTDSKSNTWTAGTQRNGAGGAQRLFYCLNPTVGAGHTFTVVTPVPSMEVQAWAGLFNASSFQTQTGIGSPSTLPNSPGSITPSQNGSLFVTGQGNTNSGFTYTIDSGFTISCQFGGSGTAVAGAMAYLTQSVAAAANPQWSVGSGQEANMSMMVFNQTGSPPAAAQTYEFKTTQSMLAQWVTRYQPDVVKRLEGAPSQQTNPIPPVATIEYSRYKRLDYVRAIPGPVAQPNQGARTEQTYIFPQAQAIRSMWPRPAQYPDVARQLTGATIQRTDPIFPFGSTVMSLYPGRQYASPLYDRFQTPVVGQATYEFKVSQPNLAWWPKPAQYPDTVKRFEGAPIQQTYEFILQQARRSQWIPPQYPDVIKRVEGATTQQTFEFTLPQARRAQWLPPQFPDVVKRVEGARIEQTYIFPQPLANPSSYPGRQFPAVAAQREQQAAAAQTYEFQLTQADRSRYPQRAIAFFAPQVTGATNQQTFEFTTPRPNLYSYPGRQILTPAPQVHQGAQRQQTYEFRMPLPNLAWYVPAPFISGYWKHWINDVPGVTPPAPRQPWPFRVSHTAGQPDPFRPSSTSGQPSPFKPSTTGLQPWPFREPD